MKKKILIVEDEFVVANDLSIMLEAIGYEINGIAASAAAALDAIEKSRPDLVLLDIQLQGPISGIQLARQLRSTNIGFIYLSANSDQATLQKAKETEPYGFLVKPIRPKDLGVTLEVACYRHEHSLESFLLRRDRLRQELISLTRDAQQENVIHRFADSLQSVVPFDLLCFAYTMAGSGHRFIGLQQDGSGDYEVIDKGALVAMTAMRERDIDFPLSAVLSTPEMQQYKGPTYSVLLEEDPLAALLDRCYHFDAAIRGSIELPALANCKLYLFSREGNTYDERHVSVLEGMQNLIGKFIAGWKGNNQMVQVTMNRKGLLTRDFFALLESEFTIARTVDYYAEKLCVTPKHLTNVIRLESGYPTSWHINQRVVIEAKRRVEVSGASLKEIAFDLGFEDVAAFSKLFKRVAGENFTNFKSHLKVSFLRPRNTPSK